MSKSTIAIITSLAALSAPIAIPLSFAQETAPQEITNQSPIEAATSFAKTLTEDAAAALATENANEEERLQAFQDVLREGLALDTIGKFMLGEARKSMTEQQLQRYTDVFPPYITRQYAEQFSGIVGQSLAVIDAKEFGRRDVIVRTQIQRTNGTPVNVDWRIRKLRSGDHKAIDIIVSGVSIMLVKREEFTAFITTNGIDALLDVMEAEATGSE